ncbi:hypothetical protein RU87_GL001302 [Lactococcus plantarum]|uniref:Uncharacterized protein n=1 Tax=Pseudolactococcus plantarum TaxID=1365 RepID=A0A2A5S1C2_9LACT|nr:hypothetical protein RU87_GL001302 [Lactococcus plantarum]
MYEDFDKYLIKFYNKNVKTCLSQMIFNLVNLSLTMLKASSGW